eukprot:7676261-Pyramimonas_sp.AAC.1
MLAHLREHAGKYGLILHLGQTKILSNRCFQSGLNAKVGDCDVEIIPVTKSEKYLGRLVCLGDYHGTELSHRMAAAWGPFARIKHVLCSRGYPPPARLRLFDAVVTPTA